MNDRTRRSVIVDDAPENTEGLSDLPDADTARRLVQAQNNPASTLGRQPQGDQPSGNDRPEWIPEKFWDGDIERSARKMAESYQSLESDRGRLANEVGTLRHLVDEALELKRTRDLESNGGSPDDEESQPVTADDLLNDPEGTLSRVAKRATEPLAQELAQTRKEREIARFQEKHPTFQEDLQDEQFLAFVGQSAYRKRLAQKVMESERSGNPDFEAADELWTAWEEVKLAQSAGEEDAPGGVRQEQELNQRGEQRRPRSGDDPNKAALTTRGGVESDVDHRPIYSRAALVKKRQTDPEGYYEPEFQALVHRAYAEGRVR